MRRKAGPAAHGVEFLGFDGGRRGELVDGRVELRPGPPALAAVTFGDLARRHVAPPRQHARTGQRIGQMHVVVPAVPVGFDRGVDLGRHDEQAIRQGCHFGIPLARGALAGWNARQRQNSRGMEDAQTSKSGRRRGDRGRRRRRRAGDAAQGRHDPHDGALRRELRQPRPAHHAARPGRHRQQGAAAHALQLGFQGRQAGARARQVGDAVGGRAHLHLQAARRRLFP